MTIDLGKIPTTLTHFSAEPFAMDLTRTYVQKERDLKPRGFWLSDESDHGWRQWSVDEDFRTDWLAWRTDFRVKRGSNVLALTTTGDILDFTREYRAAPQWVKTQFRDLAEDDQGRFNVFRGYIDWTRVTERYDGLVITPYNWNCRMHRETMWYYGWDCASGVFWNLEALEQLGDAVAVPESERTHIPWSERQDDEDEAVSA